MDINEMTRQQFQNLNYFDFDEEIDVDSVVFLPTKRTDSSGYRIFEVIAVENGKPLGKLYGYDTFSIYMASDYNRVGIDCLKKSGLMRIFLPKHEYIILNSMHEIIKK